MRIRTQFFVSMVVFGLVLISVSAMLALSEQSIVRITADNQNLRDIQTRASNLAYLANNYLQSRQNSDVISWRNQVSNISSTITQLNPLSAEDLALVSNMNGDLGRLDSIFNNTVSYVASIPENESGVVHPLLKTYSSQLSVQNQAFSFDVGVLSGNLENNSNQARLTSNALVFCLVGIFGAFFVTIYLIAFRRTLSSIGRLQKETKIIGSGNLDSFIPIDGDDEISGLSHDFNQMTANLKAVTTSKVSLEQEIKERKKTEEELRRQNLVRHGRNRIFEGVLSAGTEGALGEVCLDVVLGITGSEFGFIGEITEKGLHDIAISNLGWDACRLCDKSGHRAPPGNFEVKGIYGRVLLEGKSFFTNDPGSHPESVGIPEGHPPLKSLLGVPLVSQEKIIGMIAVANREEGYSDAERESVESLAPVIVEAFARKRTEQVLKENEHLYHSIFNNTQDGFLLVELIYDDRGTVQDFRCLQVNSAFESQTGFNASFIVGKTIRQIDSNVERYWLDKLGSIDKTGKASHLQNYNQNTKRWYDVYSYKFANGKVGSLFRDITEQKNLEKAVKDSERLAAIGATAGMVGHDIRNPLQAIISDAFLVKSELASTPDSEEKKNALESMEEIEKNTDYINKIVQDLQDYARPLNPKMEENDLEQIIEGFVLKSDWPKNIRVNIKVTGEARRIKADSYYLNRILYNLVTNSVQAMPEGGEITIAAFKEANDTVLAVQDTGVGIPKRIQDKMFTLMFTTKAKGQGFGLPVVKRMTESLGGTVTFESQEGKGTTFTVRFPQQGLTADVNSAKKNRRKK